MHEVPKAASGTAVAITTAHGLQKALASLLNRKIVFVVDHADKREHDPKRVIFVGVG